MSNTLIVEEKVSRMLASAGQSLQHDESTGAYYIVEASGRRCPHVYTLEQLANGLGVHQHRNLAAMFFEGLAGWVQDDRAWVRGLRSLVIVAAFMGFVRLVVGHW